MPFINAHGITQYYRLAGEGTPIVFVHGALIDQRSWDPQFVEFQAGFRTLGYDLRGHGRTGPSRQPQYSVRLLADDLFALLNALEIERPVLCGLSFGGMIAQTYAAEYPVAGLVLADTLVSTGEGWRDTIFRKMLYPRWLMRSAVGRLGPDRFSRLALWMARRIQGAEWLETRRGTGQYVRSCLRQMPSQETLKTIDAIYRYRAQPLERLHCPALVLFGEADAGIIQRHSAILATRLPAARASRIPRAGHMANLDNPAEFNAQVRSFLEQV